MSWERICRASSGGRLNCDMEWATVFQGGIRLSKRAKEQFFGDCEYVEIWMDKEAGKLAAKPLREVAHHAYKLCLTGDLKHSKGCWYIPCRAAVRAWDKEIKGRHHCSLVPTDDGLIEFVPIDWKPNAVRPVAQASEDK